MNHDPQNILKAFTDNQHVVSRLTAADVTEYRVLGDFIGGLTGAEEYLPDHADYERDQQELDALVEDGTLERVLDGYRLSPLGRAEQLRQAVA